MIFGKLFRRDTALKAENKPEIKFKSFFFQESGDSLGGYVSFEIIPVCDKHAKIKKWKILKTYKKYHYTKEKHSKKKVSESDLNALNALINEYDIINWQNLSRSETISLDAAVSSVSIDFGSIVVNFSDENVLPRPDAIMNIRNSMEKLLK